MAAPAQLHYRGVCGRKILLWLGGYGKYGNMGEALAVGIGFFPFTSSCIYGIIDIDLLLCKIQNDKSRLSIGAHMMY